jgi:GMP synthase (glutamine-hydrolysing)
MIALALGGAGCIRRSPTPEFGWIEIDLLAEDRLLAGATRPAWAFCSHFDEIALLPEGCTLLARSNRCAIHAFRHGTAPVYGVQAHPEIRPAEGHALLTAFAPLFPAILEHPVSRPPRDTGLAPVLVENFLAMS